MTKVRGSSVNFFVKNPEDQDLVDFIETQPIILTYHRKGEKIGVDGMLRWDDVNKRILVSSGGEFREIKTEAITD